MGPSSLQQDSNDFLALNNIHIKHHKSSPYHPATNGLVECFVQTLKQALKRDGHRSHTGNIDDGEGSTMQTQSPDDRLEGISVLKCQIGAVKATGLVILGGKQPQLGSKSCKVEIDGGGVWKRHADQMTTTGVGNGIEDEPGSMAVEPEWRLDRQGDSADQSYP
ncbi:hypothetical protein EMCRGX_G011600 [Ephydatia muelleri]